MRRKEADKSWRCFCESLFPLHRLSPLLVSFLDPFEGADPPRREATLTRYLFIWTSAINTGGEDLCRGVMFSNYVPDTGEDGDEGGAEEGKAAKRKKKGKKRRY